MDADSSNGPKQTNNNSATLRKYENAEEVYQEHIKNNTRYVIFEGDVFDAGKYIDNTGHPGGSQVIEPYFGLDIAQKMKDQQHSNYAYKLLQKFKIGEIKNFSAEHINNKAAKVTDTYHGLIPQEMHERLKRKWDYSLPAFNQIKDKFTKEEYLAFITEPKVFEDPNYQIRIFKSNFLEMFSSTPWYAIPGFWGPFLVILLNYHMSVLPDFSTTKAVLLAIFGFFEWSIFEYTLHRFGFHLDEQVPDHPIALSLHFIIHGIHHAFPQDPGRLVFPISLGIPIMLGKLSFLSCIFGYNDAVFVLAGFGVGYILYDLTHYYLHHATDSFFMKLKKYHMKHHHRDPSKGFGVSSPFWDGVFGTVFAT